MQPTQPLKLDYTIQSPQERTELVKKIIAESPPEKLTHFYLQALANYIIFAMTKEQKKSKKINTDNRMITINKRETSFQGLISKFENGEDGVYHLFTEDKNIIFTPKVQITAADLEEIDALRQLRAQIEKIQAQGKVATGRRRYLLIKQLIEMRKDQYVIKNYYKQPINCLNAIKNFNSLRIDDNITIMQDGKVCDKTLISFMNPKHISALLCNYSKIKEDCYGKFYTDGYYLMQDLDTLVDHALKDKYPYYYSLVIYKIDGKQNAEIQELLYKQYGIKNSVQYLSSLWRNKIPKLIAAQAQEDYLNWYYTFKEQGHWKKCSRCGKIKLSHNKYFSKNNSSKDGFYSICKECRNKRSKIRPLNKKPKIIKRIPYIKSQEEGKE